VANFKALTQQLPGGSRKNHVTGGIPTGNGISYIWARRLSVTRTGSDGRRAAEA
jgi:hypothetical protein